MTAKREGDKLFITFFDEDGNDEIDTSDMTANELYEVCAILLDYSEPFDTDWID